MSSFDLYQTVTDQIVAMLESGVVPWRSPILGRSKAGHPKNLNSGKQYRGVNVFLLAFTAFAKGYANRRRIRGPRGKRLMKMRGELIERSFAHNYETGAMRRTHLRRHDNIAKRLLVHVGGFNLSLVMRQLIGFGKPRRLQGLFASIFGWIMSVWSVVMTTWIEGAAWRIEKVNVPSARLAA